MKKGKIIKTSLALLLVIGLSSIALLSNKKAKAEQQDFDSNFYDYLYYFSPFTTVSGRVITQNTTAYFTDTQNNEIIYTIDTSFRINGVWVSPTFTMRYVYSDYFYIFINFDTIVSGTTYDISFTYDTTVVSNPDDPPQDQELTGWCPFLDYYIPVQTTTYENVALIHEIWEYVFAISHYGYKASTNYDEDDQEQYNLFWGVFTYTNTTLTYVIDQANQMYQQGYNTGYNDGINQVKNNPSRYNLYNEETLNTATQNGYNAGYIAGNDEGFDYGFTEGYNSGYANGLVDGDGAFVSYTNIMRTAWDGATSILNTEILGGLKIIHVITVPIILGLFLIILKLIRG